MLNNISNCCFLRKQRIIAYFVLNLPGPLREHLEMVCVLCGGVSAQNPCRHVELCQTLRATGGRDRTWNQRSGLWVKVQWLMSLRRLHTAWKRDLMAERSLQGWAPHLPASVTKCALSSQTCAQTVPSVWDKEELGLQRPNTKSAHSVKSVCMCVCVCTRLGVF